MKKLHFAFSILFCFFVILAGAQGAATPAAGQTGTAKTASSSNFKMVNPGKASPAAKPAPEKKEVRRVKLADPRKDLVKQPKSK